MGRLIAGSSRWRFYEDHLYPSQRIPGGSRSTHACCSTISKTVLKLPEGKEHMLPATAIRPFSKVIFDIAAEHGMQSSSSDIWRKRVPEELKGAAVFWKPDTVWGRTDVLKAETFRSTDEAWHSGVRWTATPTMCRRPANHWYWMGRIPSGTKI